jgi:hypothetical protein
MRDEDSIELLHVLADQREPARDLFSAEARVNENARLTRNDQNRIAR